MKCCSTPVILYASSFKCLISSCWTFCSVCCVASTSMYISSAPISRRAFMETGIFSRFYVCEWTFLSESQKFGSLRAITRDLPSSALWCVKTNFLVVQCPSVVHSPNLAPNWSNSHDRFAFVSRGFARKREKSFTKSFGILRK